jgi:hypothetical protein
MIEKLEIGQIYAHTGRYIFIFSSVESAHRAKKVFVGETASLRYAQFIAKQISTHIGETPLIIEPYINPFILLDKRDGCIRVLSQNWRGWFPCDGKQIIKVSNA